MKNQVIAVALLGTVFLAGCSSNAGNIRKEQTPSSVSASSSARSTSASPSPTESPSPSPSETPSPTASPTPEPVKTPEAVTPVAEPTPEVPAPEPEQKPVPAEETRPATEAPAPARQTSVQQEPVQQKPVVVETPANTGVYYKNCDEVRAAGAAPIHKGQPGYAAHLDRDGDGVACEPYKGKGNKRK